MFIQLKRQSVLVSLVLARDFVRRYFNLGVRMDLKLTISLRNISLFSAVLLLIIIIILILSCYYFRCYKLIIYLCTDGKNPDSI